jgi:WD40 repeat protein
LNTDRAVNTSEECFDLKLVGGGQEILTCGANNKIKLWDVARGQIINEAVAGSMGAFTIGVAANAKMAITGHGDSGLSVWNLN